MPLAIDLSGKKALVTGVTSGIGAGIAERLAEGGCDVVGCGRRPSNDADALAFCAAVRGHGQRAHYCSIDISEKEAPPQLVRETVDALGGLDILISNAGRNVFKGAQDCSPKRLGRSAWTSISPPTGGWQRLRENTWMAIPASLELSSSSPPTTHSARYVGASPTTVAKAGLVALVQSLAIEWGPGIRTVGIAPRLYRNGRCGRLVPKFRRS